MSLRSQMLRTRAPGTSFCDDLALDASGPDVSWASLPLPPQNPATTGTIFVSDRRDGALGYADSHPITGLVPLSKKRKSATNNVASETQMMIILPILLILPTGEKAPSLVSDVPFSNALLLIFL